MRVVSADRRADAVGEHDGFVAFGAERLEYRCVGGTIGLGADIGADHGAATDLVVVAADDVLLEATFGCAAVAALGRRWAPGR